MELFDLKLSESFYDEYEEQCDYRVLNEFATAAFRFGHSQIPDNFDLTEQKNLESYSNLNMLMNFTEDNLSFKEHFNNPDVVMSPYFINLNMNALINQPSMKTDNQIVSEVRNNLRINHGKLDLMALNIQRGRDHGIPGYTKYENYCSEKIQSLLSKQNKISNIDTKTRLRIFPNDLKPIRKFKQLHFDRDIIQKLQKVYEHVDDIDLITGGLSEIPVEGGVVGKTFGCIIALQFEKLRKCDRFWYETNDGTIGFTSIQLKEIKKSNLASIICNNIDKIDLPHKIQMDVFLLYGNKIDCENLPNIDLNAWKE